MKHRAISIANMGGLLKTGRHGLLLSTLLSLLYAGSVCAQQSGWPDNWLFFPKDKGEKVFRLDEGATSDSRVLEILTNKQLGGGSLLINWDMPVTELTTLKWRWNAHGLPSAVAENTEQTHSYLAIAVLFDTDQVLSYMWSATLPVGTVFWCPQPRWKDRETHLVMHSGATELGQWFNEERHLLEDYAHLKPGKPLPKAIKQVWFIAGAAASGADSAISYSLVSLGDDSTGRRKIFSQRGLSQLDKDIAAIHASLPGRWTGVLETEDLASGKVARTDVSIGYAALSNDKLDYASWGARGLTLTYYQGDGKYLLKQFPYEGEPSTIECQVVNVQPPDAAGNWSSDELVSAKDGNGDLQQWHQVWSLKGGELSVVKDRPQAWTRADLTWVRGSRARKVRDN